MFIITIHYPVLYGRKWNISAAWIKYILSSYGRHYRINQLWVFSCMQTLRCMCTAGGNCRWKSSFMLSNANQGQTEDENHFYQEKTNRHEHTYTEVWHHNWFFDISSCYHIFHIQIKGATNNYFQHSTNYSSWCSVFTFPEINVTW